MERFEKQLTTNYFRKLQLFWNKSFSCRLVHEISMIFNAGLFFATEVFILSKKDRDRDRRP